MHESYRNFDTTSNIEIGIQLSAFVLPPLINNSITLAAFRADGTIQVCNDRLIKNSKEATKTEAASFIIPYGISSKPKAFSVLGFSAGCTLGPHLPF